MAGSSIGGGLGFGPIASSPIATSTARSLVITADAGSYTFSGSDSTFLYGYAVVGTAGSYSITGSEATVYPSAYLTAISDVTDGGWTNEFGSNVNLYASIDEVVPNDSDYIQSSQLESGQSDTCEVAITPIGDPTVSYGHKVVYRYRKQGNALATMNLTVSLVDGTTVIATNVHNSVGTTHVDGEFSLSPAQADSITNYSDLRFRFTAEAV